MQGLRVTLWALKDVDGGVSVVLDGLNSEAEVCSAENSLDVKIVREWITEKRLPLVDDVIEDSVDVGSVEVEESAKFVGLVIPWSQ